jgi:hypothetical protein
MMPPSRQLVIPMCEPGLVVMDRAEGPRWIVELRCGAASTRLAIFDGYAARRRAIAYRRRVESVLRGVHPDAPDGPVENPGPDAAPHAMRANGTDRGRADLTET